MAEAPPRSGDSMVPASNGEEHSTTIPSEQGGDMNHGSENENRTEEFADETSRLKHLHAEARNQDELERDIGRQADKLLIEQADERDKKRLEKTSSEKEKLISQLRRLHQRLYQPASVSAIARIQAEVDNVQVKIDELDADLEQIKERIDKRHENEEGEGGAASSSGRLPTESQREFLIRTGKITPFSQVGGRSVMRSASNLEDVLLDAEDEPEEDLGSDGQPIERVSHRHLLQPGFAQDESSDVSAADEVQQPPRKKRRLRTGREIGKEPEDKETPNARDVETPATSHEDTSDATFEPEIDDYGEVQDSGPEGEASESGYEDDLMPDTRATKKLPRQKKAAKSEDIEDLRGVDDGNENLYQKRLQSWVVRREAARKRAQKQELLAEDSVNVDDDDENLPDTEREEWYRPHPKIADTEFDGGFKLPGDIYPYLFDYQKTGVQWLWELYSQQVGGIIGDEMGLGKTIQVIGFLAGLHYTRKLKKPIIVVCPATVMKQWVNEFHKWWPPFRVSILHTSGSGMIDIKRESKREDDLMEEIWRANEQPLTSGQKAAKKVLKRVVEEGHVLVTTYSGLQSYARLLIPVEWEYAVLDEGHKIRNPNTAITIYCKELQTHNRIILSGTPMQNNLTELWSLFDFVFPMRLGTLVNFRNQFEFPIRIGGYANASNLQVQTAMKCAETLKDTISPYLLQRFKVDVAADLPKKSEQVLFCKLTKIQRQAYEHFLGSDEMKSIEAGRRQVLYGIDILRKICNHPDLQDHKGLSHKKDYVYGSAAKSGKMQVVKALLELWRDTGHKALLFAQHRIMLDILEKFIKSLPGMRYRRMDGNTPIPMRQTMVDEFNTNPDLHVFLLTTKVGGLGVNLTGADRVIIYDPDWNPSTDLQARERAWRLGQKREVSIYRLMTAGTIEEKIYHRQIFKQFLTNKILRDPKQRQTFQMSDLHDLFTLGGENEGPTETSSIFKDAEIKYGKSAPNTAKSNGKAPDASPTEPDHHLTAVAGISSVEQFHELDESSTTTPNEDGPSTTTNPSESRLLSNIFSSPALHSTLSHDTIISGRRQPSHSVVAAEAARAASAASASLQQAGQLARSIPIGTPTWTGQVGVAGRPTETTPFRAFASSARRGGGASSSSILANLANAAPQNSHITPASSSPSAASSRAGTPNLRETAPKGQDFIPLIVNYIKAHGGKVVTQMLIDHFDRFCSSPARTGEFKEMLRRVAVLERPAAMGRRGVSAGRARWVLKENYR